MNKKDRKRTSGRFNNREELKNKVIFFDTHTSLSIPEIAGNCRVSDVTVRSILNLKVVK